MDRWIRQSKALLDNQSYDVQVDTAFIKLRESSCLLTSLTKQFLTSGFQSSPPQTNKFLIELNLLPHLCV